MIQCVRSKTCATIQFFVKSGEEKNKETFRKSKKRKKKDFERIKFECTYNINVMSEMKTPMCLKGSRS